MQFLTVNTRKSIGVRILLSAIFIEHIFSVKSPKEAVICPFYPSGGRPLVMFAIQHMWTTGEC